ncbi:MAG: hypothetical protein K2X71_06400 [Methylobacterium sp.]|uniref:hypothetical protein n=1 Tax=Methylobacterium sp. TaxID=409 RepID=UPI002582C331|nr:hypothetical protein [Methylobacterium sp.]MBY0295655.1 hypothetical protein [Methylobacterium sp.]
MATIANLGDLYKAKRLTDDDLTAAATGYLADPTPGPRKIADGISLDIAAAVLASPYATEILAREGAPEAQRRMAVRTAILLALPV